MGRTRVKKHRRSTIPIFTSLWHYLKQEIFTASAIATAASAAQSEELEQQPGAHRE
jgi:hypothetical protein